MSVGNSFARALAVAALALCLALAVGAPPASAAAAPDLGGPDVPGYCEHLGLSGASFSAPPNQSWQCVHSDGSVSPLDMQAACEFSFSQRPIVARQLTPGVPYTWQCFQELGGGAGGAAQPTAAQLKAALLRALRPSGKAAKIASLTKKGVYPMRLRALIAGSVRVSWSYLPKAVRSKAVGVAAGRMSISRAGSVTVRIVLSPAGRRLLTHARRIRLTAQGSFAARGQAAVAAAQSFTLSR